MYFSLIVREAFSCSHKYKKSFLNRVYKGTIKGPEGLIPKMKNPTFLYYIKSGITTLFIVATLSYATSVQASSTVSITGALESGFSRVGSSITESWTLLVQKTLPSVYAYVHRGWGWYADTSRSVVFSAGALFADVCVRLPSDVLSLEGAIVKVLAYGVQGTFAETLRGATTYVRNARDANEVVSTILIGGAEGVITLTVDGVYSLVQGTRGLILTIHTEAQKTLASVGESFSVSSAGTTTPTSPTLFQRLRISVRNWLGITDTAQTVINLPQVQVVTPTPTSTQTVVQTTVQGSERVVETQTITHTVSGVTFLDIQNAITGLRTELLPRIRRAALSGGNGSGGGSSDDVLELTGGTLTGTLSGTTLILSNDLFVAGTIADSSGDVGNDGDVLLSTATGTNWVATSTLGISGGVADGSFSTTSADYWKTENNFFSTTSSDYFVTQRNFFSTTSADYLATQRNFFSTSSANAYINASSTIANASGVTSGNVLQWDGLRWVSVATTTLGFIDTVDGSFSTTSADYWQTVTNFFSTTSADYLATQRNFFSTSSANAFVNASSTIANASGVTSGNVLQWDGLRWVSVATTTLGINPASGWTDAGSYLFTTSGESAWADSFNATSTTATSTFAGGLRVAGTGGVSILQSGRLGINNTSPLTYLHIGGTTDAALSTHGLAVFGPASSANVALDGDEIIARNNGSAADLYLNLGSGDVIVGNSTSNLFVRTLNTTGNTPSVWVGQSNDFRGEFGYDSTNDYAFMRSVNNGIANSGIYLPYTSGNVGIGTTSPYTKLSVVGQVVGEYFTATSTTLASTFPYASTTALSAGTICISGDCRTAWPTSGGGGVTGTWATTTSPIAGQLINYPNNTSDIVVIGSSGSSATTTAEYWFDPNTSTSYLAGNTGFGIGSPAVQAHLYTSLDGASVELLRLQNGGINSASAAMTFYGGSSEAARLTGVGNSLKFGLGVSGIEAMRLDTIGLGIGTTSPYAKLSVHAGASDGLQNIFVVATSTLTSTTTAFVINRSGNVGIGDSTPTEGQVTIAGRAATTTVFTQPTLYVLGGSGGAATDVGGVGSILQLVGGAGGYAAGSNDTTGGVGGRVLITAGTGGGAQDLEGNAYSEYGGAGGTVLITGGAGGFPSGGGFSSSVGAGGHVVISSGTGATPGNVYIMGTSTGQVLVSGSKFGFGTTSPWRTFSTVGTVAFSSTLSAEVGSDNYLCIDPVTFEVTNGGANCGASSERFKENITDLTYGLEDVMMLRPVSYNYKKEINPDQSARIGFIAEEVAIIIPEVVDFEEDGSPQSIDYEKLVALLTKAIQELSEKVDVLLANAATGVSHFLEIVVHRITTDELCVGTTCINETQLQQLLDTANVTPAPPPVEEPPIVDEPPVEEPPIEELPVEDELPDEEPPVVEEPAPTVEEPLVVEEPVVETPPVEEPPVVETPPTESLTP